MGHTCVSLRSTANQPLYLCSPTLLHLPPLVRCMAAQCWEARCLCDTHRPAPGGYMLLPCEPWEPCPGQAHARAGARQLSGQQHAESAQAIREGISICVLCCLPPETRADWPPACREGQPSLERGTPRGTPTGLSPLATDRLMHRSVCISADVKQLTRCTGSLAGVPSCSLFLFAVPDL